MSVYIKVNEQRVCNKEEYGAKAECGFISDVSFIHKNGDEERRHREKRKYAANQRDRARRAGLLYSVKSESFYRHKYHRCANKTCGYICRRVVCADNKISAFISGEDVSRKGENREDNKQVAYGNCGFVIKVLCCIIEEAEKSIASERNDTDTHYKESENVPVYNSEFFHKAFSFI